jgi:hypothetical protein
MTQLYVMLDTNIIFNPNSADQFFAPDISKIIEDPSHQQLGIQWVLPRMVVFEREYKIRQKAKHVISAAKGMPYLYGDSWVGDIDAVNQRISKHATLELNRRMFLVRDCDTARVDWNSLMTAAGYRLPPFDPDGEKEKGFKDAIVAETFLQLCADLPINSEDSAILVTEDAMLRKNVESRAPHGAKVLGTVDELSAELNFLVSDIPSEVAALLPDRASALLSTVDNTFWIDFWERAHAAYPQILSRNIPGFLSVDLAPKFFSGPSFLKKEMRRVHFVTRFLFARTGKRLATPMMTPAQIAFGQMGGLLGALQNSAPQASVPAGAATSPIRAQGYYGAGTTLLTADTPTEAVQLPDAVVTFTWSADYKVKSATKNHDPVITLAQPRIESILGGELVPVQQF